MRRETGCMHFFFLFVCGDPQTSKPTQTSNAQEEQKGTKEQSRARFKAACESQTSLQRSQNQEDAGRIFWESKFKSSTGNAQSIHYQLYIYIFFLNELVLASQNKHLTPGKSEEKNLFLT